MHKDPLVSVVMITYNHQEYIIEALEGVFIQRCNFEYEVILANDCSTDNSDEIIVSYLNNHPKNKYVKYTYHENNKGIISNFIWTLQKSKGKYVALCEGDDYWNDPLKLQKQVDFLDNNINYSAIATNSIKKNEVNNTISLFLNSDENQILNIDNLLKERKFHTASLMFRNSNLESFNLPMLLSADRYLFLFLASKNPIFYLNEVTCVYRVNDGGISRRVNSNSMMLDLNLITSAAEFLKKNQLNVLKTFVYKTILQYSFQIRFSHFFYIGIRLLFITKFKRSSLKLIRTSISKINLNVS